MDNGFESRRPHASPEEKPGYFGRESAMGSHERETDEYSWGPPHNKPGSIPNRSPYQQFSVFEDVHCTPSSNVRHVPVIAPQLVGPQTDAKPSPPAPAQVCAFTLFERCLFALAAVFGTLAAITWLFVVIWGYLAMQQFGQELGRIGGSGVF